MPQNLIEKIIQKFIVDAKSLVHSGNFVTINPSYVMTHDNTGAVIPKFKSIGATKLYNPNQVVITLDHDIQNKSEKNLEKYKKIEEFANKMGADFYPAGRGIGHQIMVEEGYAFPGTLVVASDSHSNMYGGIGCLGTPIVRTDAASIWATGKTWWQIPPVAKVIFNGQLKKGVSGKDVIISLCGFFNKDEVLNHALEFTGEGISSLSIDQRLTISNMTTEWGALVGLFPTDNLTIDWLKRRNQFIKQRGLEHVASDVLGNGVHPRINDVKIEQLENELKDLKPDQNAFYSKIIHFDLSSVEPFVSGPNSVKVFNPVSTLKSKKIKIDKAYLVSCVNSRVEDLAEAANILKGKKIADHVKFYVGAASSEVQNESEKRGDFKILTDAGAIPLPPGCGPCIGLGVGLLEDGEVGISATNRNFKGRMGSSNALAYLASPSVVASSVITGYIDYEWRGSENAELGKIEVIQQPLNDNKIETINGFPQEIKGRLIFCHQDNLNTDGIYPGKYTYNDDITPEEQAKVVMENYDTNFVKIAQKGDILVGGFNFGTGSSREQAATALKYFGIQAIVAGSFNETYKRNAINNGVIVIEAADFVKDLKNKVGTDSLTINTGLDCIIDFSNSKIDLTGTKYKIEPFGTSAQELVVSGGLENWIKMNL